MNNKNKRNLSVAEYFLQIQKEYIIAEFKKKIYFNPKNKAYWKRVMGYKLQKINEISERNNLRNIFNDKNQYKTLYKILFDEDGKPKFEMNEIDKENYYCRGNEFSYKGDVYTLDQINHDGKLVLYSKIKEEYIEVSKDDVSRIL